MLIDDLRSFASDMQGAPVKQLLLDAADALEKSYAGAGDAQTVGSCCAKAYVDRAIASYVGDPADNQFQKGFLAALEVVRDEAFPCSVTSTDRAVPGTERGTP